MKKRLGSLYKNMIFVTVLPIFVLGLIITVYCLDTYTNGMTREVEIGLRNMAVSIESAYNELYEGEYALNDSGELTKGDKVLSEEYGLFNSIKANADVEISLICNDTRMITTIVDSNGNRMTGTTINEKISEWIRENDSAYFSTAVVIDYDEYYGYYLPVYENEKDVDCVIFVGMPQAEVKGFLDSSIARIIIISAICLIITMIITILYTHELITHIKKMTTFMKNVGQGRLSKGLDESILSRNDELGKMGRHASNMQEALHRLVEQDVLTELYNRRCGDMKLKKLYDDNIREDKDITIAISDIDFFKSINDNYGHDAGDVVLKSVADILKENIRNKGFVCRWGGEEFLFAFYNNSIEETRNILEDIRIKVERNIVNYENYNITTTMTFGVSTFETGKSIEELLKEADDNLYKGKNNGRNQVIC